MKECNSVKQSPLAGLAAYGGGAGSVIFGRKGVGGYQIERSLRFNSGERASLIRTPSTSGNRKTFTFACWLKVATSGTQPYGCILNQPSGDDFILYNRVNGTLEIYKAGNSVLTTNAVFRDPSAWQHFVFAVDTTQSTASNRFRIYHNGSEITSYSVDNRSSNIAQNSDFSINTTNAHNIGGDTSHSHLLEGYLADIHFIDGQSLGPSSFGETNDDGIWDPKKYTGSFGTNGFHLKFDDASDLGEDSSGNNNDFTANGLYNQTTTLPGVNFTSSTSDYLSHPTNTDFNFTGDFTIECYVKVTAYNASGASTIAGTGSGSWSFGLSNTGKVSFGHYGVQGFFSGGNSVLENEWTHVAVARSGSSVKGFINGVEVVSTSYSASMSNSNALYIGGDISNASQHFNGVISNLNIVTGTALYTSNFAKPNAPLSANGNTKLLCCQSCSSTTAAAVAPGTLSANGSVSANNFTDSGSGSDALRDSPVAGTESDTGAGGEVSGNYCTLNPLANESHTLSNGNLDITNFGSTRQTHSTILPSSGKWYAEFTCKADMNDVQIGVANSKGTSHLGADSNSWGVISINGNRIHGGGSAQSSYGSSYTSRDIIMVALDLDNGKWYAGKNGTWFDSGNPANGTNPAHTGLSGNIGFAVGSNNTGGFISCNFGARSFAYAAPSGFKALCTTNLSDPTIANGANYFDIALYTGNGSTQSVSLSTAPDLLWLKSRSASKLHALCDSARGDGQLLYSSSTLAEQDIGASVVDLTSSGFNLGFNSGFTQVSHNHNGESLVAWAWNAGANSNRTYTVKVVSDSGNKYRFDDHGTSAVTLDLAEGSTYIFDQSDSSNSGHPLRFSTTSNGTHGGGSEYTTGVTVTGTPGQAGAKTTIVVAASAPTLFYYCTQHSGMGGQINTNSTAGSTILSSSADSSTYNTSQNWLTTGTITGTPHSAPYTFSPLFDGVLTGLGPQSNSTSTQYVYTFGSALSATADSIIFYSTSDVANVPAGSGAFYINGTQVTTSNCTRLNSGSPYKYRMDGLTTLSSIGSQQRANMTGIEVNGKLLVDSNAHTPPSIPSMNSVVKASTETGFSVVTYTGNGTAGSTVGHGLSAAPEWIVCKDRDDTDNWQIYHAGAQTSGAKLLKFTNDAASSNNGPWNNTAPTSSVVTLGGGGTNDNGNDHIMYCWTPVSGFSAFGSYEGNNTTDGPFVHTGFKPRWVLIKNIDSSTQEWVILDTARNTFNVTGKVLYANTSGAEADLGAVNDRHIDILSNGFKVNRGDPLNQNATHVFAAFAEHPFKTARAR